MSDESWLGLLAGSATREDMVWVIGLRPPGRMWFWGLVWERSMGDGVRILVVYFFWA